MKNTFLSLALLFFTGCSTPLTALPPPTPQVLLIDLSSALAGWQPKIYACAQDFPQLAVFAVESVTTGGSTIKLQLGAPDNTAEPDETVENSYVIAQEEVILIASPDFPLNEISISQLQGIFTGQLTTSQSLVPEAEPDLIQPWTYPTTDETRRTFEGAVFSGEVPPIQALIAPDPASMLKTIVTTSRSIGYLPGSALSLANAEQSGQFKILPLADESAAFRQPVIAQLSVKPDDLLNAYLQCLEDKSK